jgi:hypothetical protein
MREDDEPATEGDPVWREQMQETAELAELLQPPHDDDVDVDAPRDHCKRD